MLRSSVKLLKKFNQNKQESADLKKKKQNLNKYESADILTPCDKEKTASLFVPFGQTSEGQIDLNWIQYNSPKITI